MVHQKGFMVGLFKDFKTKYLPGKSSEEKALIERIDNLESVTAEYGYHSGIHYVYTGEKFAGGWGIDKNYEVVNLSKLQQHSLELWRSNPIANAIFGRLETKVIGDGLQLEATPDNNLLSMRVDEEFINQWSENIESYHNVLGSIPSIVDERERFTMPELQRQAYNTAKLSGDALIITRIDSETFLPRIQIIDGKHIKTPFEFSMGTNPRTGRSVINGVEVTDNGVEVGYWVKTMGARPGMNKNFDFTFMFIPAFGKNSGRRVARLLYGSRLRVDEFRGMPLLGHVMQMLKKIDTAMDTSQQAMALDASLVMSVVTDKDAKRSVNDILGDGPLATNSVRDKTVNVPQPNGTTKDVEFKQFGPGMVIDNLPPGKKIESHNTRHPNPDLMKSVMGAFNLASASCDIPPEMLLLLFNNNFSASRQAVNEFEATKRKEQVQFNAGFNDPYYRDMVIALEITGKVHTPGLLDSIARGDFITTASWLKAQWINKTELSVDMLKHINMLERAHKLGYLTREQAAKKFFGTSVKQNLTKLKKENEALAEVNKPLVELETSQGG